MKQPNITHKISSQLKLFVLFLILQPFCFGQQFFVNLDEYKKKYNYDLVTLNKFTQISLEVDDDKIVIEKTDSEDSYFLNQYAQNYSYISLNYEAIFHEITDIKAYTLKPEDKGGFSKINVSKNDIQTKKVMSNEVFYDGEMSKEFQFPTLQEGAISHLTYKEITKDPHFFGRFFFSDLHPIEKQKLMISVENSIQLEFTYVNCTKSYFEFSKTSKNNNTIYVWQKKDIPSLQLPDDGPGFLELAPHIIVRITQYKSNDGKTIPVYRNVGDLFAWNAAFLDSIKNDKFDFANRLIDSIVPKNSSKKETVALIYKWVQNNISYIAIENGLGGFTPRSPKKVYNRRYGDCKDKACLLVHLLKAANINAHYTWIGTREIPYDYNTVPMALANNHMIVAWKYNDKYIFLDPTSEELPFGYPSDFIQDKTALIYLDEQKFDTVRVPIVAASENKRISNIHFKIEKGALIGSIKSKGYAYFSNTLRLLKNEMNPKKEEKLWESWFEIGNNSFALIPNSVTIEEGEMTKANCKFKIDNYIVTIGDEIYVNPILDRKWNGKIIAKDRKYPYKYHSEYKIVNKYVFEVPEGYTVKFIPKGKSESTPMISYIVNYEKTGEKEITASYTIQINSLSLEPKDFDRWNVFSRNLKTVTNQSIVLKKQD